MSNLDPSRCPSAETLAGFIDHCLDEASREVVIDHAADCDSCRFVIASAAWTRAGAIRQRRLTTTVRTLAVAAGLAVLVGLGWWLLAGRYPDVADVLAAAGPERRLPSRLTAAPYQPTPPTYRAGDTFTGDTSSADSTGEPFTVASPEAWEVAAAAQRARKAAALYPSTGARQALAAAHLLLRNHSDAIAIFAALAAEDAGADAKVDLAAALIARGMHEGEPVDVVRALELLGEALALEPSHPAALFNRALALEHLTLSDRAAQAWEEYLEVDATSGWAEEARLRLDALGRTPAASSALGTGSKSPRPDADPAAIAAWARGDPGTAARWIRTRQLAEWAQAWRSGQSALAEQALSDATVAAAAIAERTGDRSLVATLQAAADPAARDRLAAAHATYGDAWGALDDLSGEEARAAFAGTAATLETLGDGEAQWHRVGALAAELYAGADADTDAGALRGRLSQALDATTAPLAHAHLLWLRGLSSLRRGHNDAAITDLAAAYPVLHQAGERENAAWVRFLESEALMSAGDAGGGWRSRLEALRAIRPGNARRATLLLGAAAAAHVESAPLTALAFQEEALPLVEDGSPAAQVAEAWLWRALILQQVDQPEDARAAAQRAAAMVQNADELDPGLAEHFQARHRLAEALIGGGRVEEDLRRIDDTLLAGDGGMPFLTPLLLRQRARLHLAAGDVRGARRDLETTVAEAASLRLEPARELWAGGRDIGREALEAAIDLDIEVFDDPWSALRTLLRYRNRGPAPWKQTDPVAALVASLDPGEAVIAYVQVGERLLSWKIEQGRTAWATVGVPEGGLAGAVERWVATLGSAAGDEEGERLGRSLLPYWRREPLPRRIRILADEALAGLPWAALPIPGSGRALIHETEVTLSPQGFPRPQHPLEGDESLLVVADAAATTSLEPLPGTREEAAGLERLFSRTLRLVGPEASRDRVIHELASAELVHLGTHAWAHPRLPALARLSLVPDADGRSWLLASEIPDLPLDQTALVVLAGCSTALSPGATGTAVHGLAQGFMAAGVPSVLGTLWPVEDAVTASLFLSFYRQLANGRPPQAALRHAQLELLARGAEPRSWAGFVLLRG